MNDKDPAAGVVRSRPPVHQSTLVRSDRRHTFEVFVRTIAARRRGPGKGLMNVYLYPAIATS
jgi:hypothetical protein